MHAIGVSNPNVPIFPPRVCTLVLFILLLFIDRWMNYNNRVTFIINNYYTLNFGAIYNYSAMKNHLRRALMIVIILKRNRNFKTSYPFTHRNIS